MTRRASLTQPTLQDSIGLRRVFRLALLSTPYFICSALPMKSSRPSPQQERGNSSCSYLDARVLPHHARTISSVSTEPGYTLWLLLLSTQAEGSGTPPTAPEFYACSLADVFSGKPGTLVNTEHHRRNDAPSLARLLHASANPSVQSSVRSWGRPRRVSGPYRWFARSSPQNCA